MKIEQSPVEFMSWYHREFSNLWATISTAYSIPSLSWYEGEEEAVYCGRKPGNMNYWPASTGAALAMGLVGDINKWVVWNFCKRAYIVHPALQEAVTNSVDDKTAIPGEALRHLPHDEALIWLADPVKQWSEVDRRHETYLALLYMGSKDFPGSDPDEHQVQLCQLSDPEVDHVSITFVGYYEHLTPEGVERRPTRFTISVDLDQTWTLMGAAIKVASTMEVLEAWEEMSPDLVRRRKAVENDQCAYAEVEILPLLKVAIGLLAYICSQEVDLEDRPKPRNKSAAKREAADGVRRYNLGYRIGPQIDAQRASHRKPGDGDATGRTVAPHIRRGHFHTVLYGPGKLLRKVQWFAPTAVRSSKTEAAEITTLHGLGRAG